ncbi:MAG: hypothetical protein BWY80_00683 [Firmicutes bacterium ADurb.Bin456]|nr:MAG: hypothetical protein BWY80_00683 [Firmicutes bacterium ADurb.Bin456]
MLRPGLGDDLNFTVCGITSQPFKVILNDPHFLQVQEQLIPAQVKQFVIVHLPDGNHFGAAGCSLDNKGFGPVFNDIFHGCVDQQAVNNPVKIVPSNILSVKTVDPTRVGSNEALHPKVLSRLNQGSGLRVHNPWFVGYLQRNRGVPKDGAVNLILLKHIFSKQSLSQEGGNFAADGFKTKNPCGSDFFHTMDTKGVVDIVKNFLSLAVGYSLFGNNPHFLDH